LDALSIPNRYPIDTLSIPIREEEEEYQRLIDRIDDVLEGRAGEFLTGSAALKWVRGEDEKSPSG